MSKKKNKKRNKKRRKPVWNFKYAVDLIKKNYKVFALNYNDKLTFLEDLTRKLYKTSFFFKLEQTSMSKKFYNSFTHLNDDKQRIELIDGLVDQFKNMSTDDKFLEIDNTLATVLNNAKKAKIKKPIDQLTDEDIKKHYDSIFEPLAKLAENEDVKPMDDEKYKEYEEEFDRQVEETFGPTEPSILEKVVSEELKDTKKDS